ncbi:putative NADH:ubiquinone oxidoreductase [Candidatus Promineifilum breve]|uniref:NADH:ubiquinone oxidoreductase n=1 Tax=Candidatus Promineifilum breve TaxID=1806508 RepID=A0A160T5K1_9CHLR|nr:NAD(P)H-dependent oxidoreductase subunit E [Candidatus Promineifilum breve]CUS03990.2 putative NADH:ubiquinone oxidoreductase [Candidatus Promineifilum breve]
MVQPAIIDMSALEPLLAHYRGRGREALLPLLHDAQAIYGWLPREVLEAIGATLRVPLADIHGVVEFYSMFYNKPTARRVIRVCFDPACHMAGSPAVRLAIEERLGLRPGETSADGSISYETVPCLGMCEHAPNALNGDRPAGNLTPDDVDAFLAGAFPEPEPKIYGGPLVKLARAGKIDPTSLTDFEKYGGYKALRKALTMTPEEIIATMKGSDVLGRGGAMFPVGLKWEMARNAPGHPAEKHIIANADESEPGTFKDRALMEQDPFNLLEAMTISGYAVGAENGWIFLRGEYPRCYKRLHNAIERAREAGYLGRDILGRRGFNFDIELRLGAGAYICGEETALFEAIEGKRGFPRIKPPFPTTHGLFQQPTVINNIETLAATVAVLNMGTEQWHKLGTPGSPGTKWFCVSGRVLRPGVYEVPFGLTVRQLIQMAGGVIGKEVQAVLLGGAAGVFIGPRRLDTPLTYEDAKAQNFPLGSGVIMVFDEAVDLREIMYMLARFFAHESCGKCYPCALGTQRQLEIIERILRYGGPRADDKRTLQDIGLAMTQTSLCGLGQTAASAILSAAERWPELFEPGGGNGRIR